MYEENIFKHNIFFCLTSMCALYESYQSLDIYEKVISWFVFYTILIAFIIFCEFWFEELYK